MDVQDNTTDQGIRTVLTPSSFGFSSRKVRAAVVWAEMGTSVRIADNPIIPRIPRIIRESLLRCHLAVAAVMAIGGVELVKGSGVGVRLLLASMCHGVLYDDVSEAGSPTNHKRAKRTLANNLRDSSV